MWPRCDALRQPSQDTTCLAIPVGRAKAHESRHEIDAIAIGHAGGQRLALRRRVDQTQAIAQPLHRGPRGKDAAFQSIGHLAPELPGHRGQEPMG